MDTQVKRIAANNKRITKWARTDSYKLLTEARQHATFSSPAFNISSSHSCRWLARLPVSVLRSSSYTLALLEAP